MLLSPFISGFQLNRFVRKSVSITWIHYLIDRLVFIWVVQNHFIRKETLARTETHAISSFNPQKSYLPFGYVNMFNNPPWKITKHKMPNWLHISSTPTGNRLIKTPRKMANANFYFSFHFTCLWITPSFLSLDVCLRKAY